MSAYLHDKPLLNYPFRLVKRANAVHFLQDGLDIVAPVEHRVKLAAPAPPSKGREGLATVFCFLAEESSVLYAAQAHIRVEHRWTWPQHQRQDIGVWRLRGAQR